MTAPAAPWSPFVRSSKMVPLPLGRQLQLFEGGTGGPLLYLHGFGLQRGWNGMLEALAGSHHVYAPLFAGFGESTGIENIDEAADVVSYLNGVLDALGLDTVDLVGFDLGGMLAAEFAAAARARVRRLALIAPFGLWAEGDEPEDFFAIGAASLPPLLFEDASSEAAKEWAPSVDQPEAVLELTIQRTRAMAASTKFLWPIPDRGLSKRLHSISSPTLVLWGESDRLIPPSYAKRFQQQIPGARVEMLPGAHMLPLEQPQETAAAVGRFLAG